MHDPISHIILSPSFESALRHRIGRRAEVDDAIQDTWIKTKNLSIPTDRDTFAWLLCIATNCAKDSYKRESRLKRREKRPDAFRRKPDSQEFTKFAVPVDTTIPGSRLERLELQHGVRRKICEAGLPDRYRHALWDRLNNNPIRYGAKSGKPTATLRVWAMRARDILRPVMQQAGFDCEI